MRFPRAIICGLLLQLSSTHCVTSEMESQNSGEDNLQTDESTKCLVDEIDRLWKNLPQNATILLVVDHAAFEKFDRNLHRVNGYCLQLVNYMNSHSGKVNLTVVLGDVLIWYEQDSICISNNATSTVTSFDHYNRDILSKYSNHSHALLITGNDLFNTALGASKSLLTTSMFPNSSVVYLGSELSETTFTVGVNPENAENSEPSTTANAMTSPISLNFEDFVGFLKNKTRCFHVQPMIKQYEPNRCGNYVLDSGEECDVGQRDKNSTKCCDPWTCRLTPDTTCRPAYTIYSYAAGALVALICFLVFGICLLGRKKSVVNVYQLLRYRNSQRTVPHFTTTNQQIEIQIDDESPLALV